MVFLCAAKKNATINRKPRSIFPMYEKNQIVEKRKMRPSWFHQPIDSKRQFLRISRDKTLCIKNAREFYKKCGKTFQFFLLLEERLTSIDPWTCLFATDWVFLFQEKNVNGTKKNLLIWFNYIELLILVHFLLPKKKLKLYLKIFFHHQKKLGLNLYIAIWLCECGASSFKD